MKPSFRRSRRPCVAPGHRCFLLFAALASAVLVPVSRAAGPSPDPIAGVPAAAPVAPAPFAAGAVAPEFKADQLDGGTLSLASLRGRVVLLNFWGISCPPCRVEMPELEAMHRRLAPRGLVVLGVAEMNPTPEQARRFLSEVGTTYPIVLDPGERLGALYRLEAHPTTFVIDARGTITFVNEGYLKGEEKEIEAAVLQALKTSNGEAR